MPIHIFDNVKNKLEENRNEGNGMMYLSIGEVDWLISETERLKKENKQIKDAYEDRVSDIESLEKLLERVERETTDYGTKITIQRALTIAD